MSNKQRLSKSVSTSTDGERGWEGALPLRNLYLNYFQDVNSRWSLQFSANVYVRDIRPDGVQFTPSKVLFSTVLVGDTGKSQFSSKRSTSRPNVAYYNVAACQLTGGPTGCSTNSAPPAIITYTSNNVSVTDNLFRDTAIICVRGGVSPAVRSDQLI